MFCADNGSITACIKQTGPAARVSLPFTMSNSRPPKRIRNLPAGPRCGVSPVGFPNPTAWWGGAYILMSFGAGKRFLKLFKALLQGVSAPGSAAPRSPALRPSAARKRGTYL